MRISKHKLFLQFADVFILLLALPVAMLLTRRSTTQVSNLLLNIPSMVSILLLVLTVIIIFRGKNLYKYHRLFDSSFQLSVTTSALLAGFAVLVISLFVFKLPLIYERRIIIIAFMVSVFVFIMYRGILLKRVLKYALRKGIIGKRVALVGDFPNVLETSKELMNNGYSYLRPVGVFSVNSVETDSYSVDLKLFGSIDQIEDYADDFDELLVTESNATYDELQATLDKCKQTGKRIHVSSELYRIIPEKLEVERYDGLSTFQIVNRRESWYYSTAKRTVDCAVSVFLLLLFFPIWLLVAFLIKIGSPGPVFYRAQVIGHREKPFVWYKFRTMYCNKDDSAHRLLIQEIATGIRKEGKKLTNDDRITPVGKFLRKHSIDEFPQFFNVLKGQMSIVGPRPVLSYEHELMDSWQKTRFSVLPGVTGLWQVTGRNEVGYNDQHVLDLYYVDNRSFWLDLEIMIRTVWVVLSGRTGV